MRISQLRSPLYTSSSSEESLRLGSIYGARSGDNPPNPALSRPCKQPLQPCTASTLNSATVTTCEDIPTSKAKSLLLRGKKRTSKEGHIRPGAPTGTPQPGIEQARHSRQTQVQAEEATPLSTPNPPPTLPPAPVAPVSQSVAVRGWSNSSGASTPTVETLITANGPPPLPRFHSRQCVPPNRNELLLQCAIADHRSQCLADRHLVDSPRSRSPASSMALKFLGGHSGSSASSAIKYFDIRLDNDYIVVRGSEDEAASAQLAGSVVLCLTEPLQMSHIQLTLSGIVHISWQSMSTSSMSGRKQTYKEKTFFEKTWPFKVAGKTKTEILAPDNYEWPFDTILEGALPESIEGLKDAWIIYRLKAEIGRKRAKDIVVRKPLRIVRTLDPSALELAHAMSVENIWPNKIEYSISIPSKAIVFGSFVRVDFKLIPLLKGLVIGNISTQIKEEQEFIVDPEWGVNAFGAGQTKVDRLIAHDNYTLDPEQDEQIIDEAAEGYQFSRFLELPKTLNKCLQDCNVKGIKVRHKVKFNVQLHNPDGHVSELRANLPVSLYISPNLPINEHNDLVDQSPQAGRAAAEQDLTHSAPPLYGEHTLDKLYSEVDPSGYLTPGIGLSTPGTPFMHSRQASYDNLRGLNATTNGTVGHSTPNGTTVSAVALQHRLQNLDVGEMDTSNNTDDFDLHIHPASGEGSRRDSDPNNNNDDYFSPHGSSNSRNTPHTSPPVGSAANSLPHANSIPMSRRVSEEDEDIASGARTPFPQFAHMEDLSRVPSYSTAVKTAAPRRIDGDASTTLPTYGAAMTGPSPPVLAEPPTAHIRSSSRSRDGSAADPAEYGGSSSSAPSLPRNRSVSAIQDDERRLRLLQARGRR